MYQSQTLTEIALRKADLCAEALRIRRELDAHVDELRSFAQLAQLGCDLVKTLGRPEIAAPTLFGICTGYTSRRIQSTGFVKAILTAGRVLLRVLPR